MLKEIKKTTIINNESKYSLKTVIPQPIPELLELNAGDSLNWYYTIGSESIILKINKNTENTSSDIDETTEKHEKTETTDETTPEIKSDYEKHDEMIKNDTNFINHKDNKYRISIQKNKAKTGEKFIIEFKTIDNDYITKYTYKNGTLEESIFLLNKLSEYSTDEITDFIVGNLNKSNKESVIGNLKSVDLL